MPINNNNSPFLTELREAIRIHHYSIWIEQAYMDWIKRFIFFHKKLDSNEMRETEVAAFLTHLAVDRAVGYAPRTLSQERCA